MASHGKTSWRFGILAGGLLAGGLSLCGGPAAALQEPNLTQLLPALEAPGAPQRLAALYQITDLARRQLNPAERRNLARQLGPKLAQLGMESDRRIQQAALDALGRLSVPAEVAAPAYEQALLALETAPRQLVADAIAQRWRAGLADLSRADQASERAVEAAAWLRDSARLAPLCARLLADKEPSIRGKTRAACDETWQALAKMTWLGVAETGGRHAELRHELPVAAQAWAALAPSFGPQLQSGAAPDRVAAGQALESLARLLRQWERQALTWGLSAEQVKGLRAANQSLSNLAPSLLAVLPEAPPDVQLGILGVLEAMESDAEPARSYLVELCAASKSSFVRWSCLRILSALTPPPTAEDWNRVCPLLQDDDGDVRQAALRLMAAWAAEPLTGGMAQAVYASPHGNGPLDRRNCVARLAAVVERGAPHEQTLALTALGRLGEEATAALPQLRLALQKARPEVRRQVPETLRQIGLPARSALELALADADEEVRLNAARALQRLGK